MESFRRVWDRKSFERKALERTQNEQKGTKQEPLVTKETLEKDMRMRSRAIVIGKTSLAIRKNFYCDICGVQSNDSIGYISHLNSKDHMKHIGKNVKHVERSSLQQVQERLASAKRKATSQTASLAKLAKKPKRHKEEQQQQEDVDEDIKRVMGFGEFSSSSNKK